jgi:hypothetical protein
VFTPLDQIESKIVRARRAAIRSKKIILAANDDLEAHRQWVERHRLAWADALESFQRSLRAKERVRAVARSLVLILVLPVSIIKLAYQMVGWMISLLGPAWRWLVPAFGFAALLIAVAAVRAPISAMRASPENPDLSPEMAKSTSNVTTAPHQNPISHETHKPTSGFRLIAAPFASHSLSMPPRTIALMLTIANPLALTHVDHDVTTRKSLAPSSSALPKVKRNPPKHKPQRLPWLRQLPWIAVR